MEGFDEPTSCVTKKVENHLELLAWCVSLPLVICSFEVGEENRAADIQVVNTDPWNSPIAEHLLSEGYHTLPQPSATRHRLHLPQCNDIASDIPPDIRGDGLVVTVADCGLGLLFANMSANGVEEFTGFLVGNTGVAGVVWCEDQDEGSNIGAWL